MPPIEIGRVFTKAALLKTEALLSGAYKIGIDAIGDIPAGSLRSFLAALKDQVDLKATAQSVTTALAGKADTTRLVATTGALTGGGDLSADRTLDVRAASELQTGVVELATTAEATAGTDTAHAVHPAGLKAVADTKAALDHDHDASDLTTGTISVARIGTGTKDATTIYYGDGTFKTAPSTPAASSVSYAGSANLASTNVEAALDELDAEKASSQSVTDHLNDTTAAHAASAISYAGGTGVSATDVESALDELATEKQDTATNYNYVEQTFTFKGTLPTANGTTAGTLRIPIILNATIVNIVATCATLPTGSGSSQTVDILRNGTSLYSSVAKIAFVPGGSQFISGSLPETTALTGGSHYLNASIITAGSPTAGGADIVVVVRYRI